MAAYPAVGQVVRGPLPRELVGNWVIKDAIGAQPMLLEVPRMAALIGRDVDLGEDFRLWDLIDAKVSTYQKRTGLLRDFVTYPIGADSREIAEGNHRFDMYEIGLSACRYRGKPVDACPVFLVGHDLDTDQIGLVTFPFGFAAFERQVRPGNDNASGPGVSR